MTWQNKHGLRIWDRTQLHRADRLWIMKRLHKDLGPAPLKHLPTTTTKWSLNLRNGGRKGYRYSIFLEEGMTPLREEPEKQRDNRRIRQLFHRYDSSPFQRCVTEVTWTELCVMRGDKVWKECLFASPSITRIPNWRLGSELVCLVQESGWHRSFVDWYT